MTRATWVALGWGACCTVWLGGCAPNGPPSASGGTARTGAEPADAPSAASGAVAVAEERDCVTGVVGTGGTQFAPLTVIRVEGERAVSVEGPRTAHVRLLSGTLVTVCGTRHTSPERIEPARLELREVDGMSAFLGTLEQADSAWTLVPEGDGLAVPLSSVPAALRGATGRTVWVAGAWAGEAFEVRSFGVLEGWR